MNAAEETPQAKPTPPPAGRGPSWMLRIFVVCCLLAILIVRWTNLTGDQAVTNILTLILGFVVFMTLGIWFTFFSRFAASVRFAAPLTLVCALVAFVACFKITAVSGELIPRFRFRWQKAADRLLAKPTAASDEEVDLTVQEGDFAQFLGPDRNAIVPGVSLAEDWEQHPPEEVWRQPIGAGWSPFSAANGFAVTLEQRGKQELVTCYEIATGKLRWSHAIEARHESVLGGIGPRSAVTINSGRVFALGATGVLRCLDGATGKALWQDDLRKRYGVGRDQDLARIAWGRSGSPLVVGERVIVPAGGSLKKPVSLIAFNKRSGEKLWEAGERLVSYSSPVVGVLAGQRQIVSVNEDAVTGHRIDNGEVLWEFEWPGNSSADANASQPVLLPQNRVLVSKGYGAGAEVFTLLRLPSGRFDVELFWKSNRVLKTKFTNVAVADGFAYGLSDGSLECVDLRTGKRKWKRRGRYGHGQVLRVGDVLLVQCESGEVVMVDIDPQRHHVLGRFQALNDKTWNNLCFQKPYLLVRNAVEAACYRLQMEGKDTGRE